MRIAPHHIPGTSENKLSALFRDAPDYAPACAWPDDCTVQWGHGLVPAVPFFEAFPAGTFIRGEGTTIADAERQAFEQYQRDLACDHIWGRHRPGSGTYTNGAAFCRKCGAFRSRMFPEIQKLGWWRKPLSRMERDYLRSLEEDHKLSAIMDRKYPQYRESRRKTARVLRLRFNLFGCEAEA